MAYVVIQDLDINKNYTAREIDLITFKSIIAKIQTFSNALKQNVEVINTTLNLGATVFKPSYDEPVGAKAGDLWIKLLN